MTLLYLYIFENNLPATDPERLDKKTGLPYPSLAVYAPSEVLARVSFKEDFGLDAGKLIGRYPW